MEIENWLSGQSIPAWRYKSDLHAHTRCCPNRKSHHGMSHRRAAIIMRLIHSCPAYASSHGLGPAQVHEVARMTTLATMLYASLAWWGFTTANDRDRLERLVRRHRRGGFLPGDAKPIAEMANDADERLFRAITTDPNHVLRQLLPKPKHTGYVLRPRAHVWLRTSCEGRTQFHLYPEMNEERGPPIGRFDSLVFSSCIIIFYLQ